MQPIGFSTGALAGGDFVRGLDLQRPYPQIRAVELSALRDHELPLLAEAARSLDLARFEYVSFHAPSKLTSLDERSVFDMLATLPEEWPIIAHPEILRTPSLWRSLASRLCIENMDNRKTLRRTAAELRVLFHHYPEATFCLDLGEARRTDPTMAVTLLLLFEFGARLRQLHVSDVGPRGERWPVRTMARWAFGRVAHRVPQTCPLIIESMVEPGKIAAELDSVAEAFDVEKARESREQAFA